MLSHKSIDGVAGMLQLTAGTHLLRTCLACPRYAFTHSPTTGTPCSNSCGGQADNSDNSDVDQMRTCAFAGCALPP